MNADKYTDEQLQQLEGRIRDEYTAAWKDAKKETDAYFKSFKKRDAAMHKRLEDGDITEDYYQQWRMNQIGRGKRYEAMRDALAKRITDANVVATAYINDSTPGIFSLNYNYQLYQIDQACRIVNGYSMGNAFTLMNEQAVKLLIMQNRELLPAPRIDIPANLLWNQRKIQQELTSGIMCGDSIGALADRFEKVTDMNRNAAIRNARTAYTGAQNAGHHEANKAAADSGVDLVEYWLSSLDARTRNSHRKLDGEIKPVDKEYFSNGCRFPGDPRGEPKEVYNCRCRLGSRLNTGGSTARRVAVYKTDEATGRQYKTYDIVEDITYKGRDNTISYEKWIKQRGG